MSIEAVRARPSPRLACAMMCAIAGACSSPLPRHPDAVIEALVDPGPRTSRVLVERLSVLDDESGPVPFGFWSSYAYHLHTVGRTDDARRALMRAREVEAGAVRYHDALAQLIEAGSR